MPSNIHVIWIWGSLSRTCFLEIHTLRYTRTCDAVNMALCLTRLIAKIPVMGNNWKCSPFN